MRAPLLVLALVGGSPTSAAEWPQWRGPDRTGVAATRAPASWPETLHRAWRIPVGIGHASPVTQGDAVFQFFRAGEREVVRSLRLEDGSVLWEESYGAPYTMNAAARTHGQGPKSTPLLFEGRLYTLGINGALSCFDAASGRVLWRRDFGERFETTSPLYGTATSPMVATGKLIVHLGGPGDGALMALDPETGRPIWAYEGDGPGYASPIVVTLGGVEQVVTQTDAHIVGASLQSGRLLWRMPFTTPYDQNIVTPILHGELLIFSGLEAPTFAAALREGSSGLEAREVWRSPASFYMSTPVLAGDRLFGLSHKSRGRFVALDAASGAELWASEGRQGDNASLVRLGEWLLALTDAGELLVLRADASSFSPVRRYSVAESPTWAHPVPTSRGILVKDESSLALYRLER